MAFGAKILNPSQATTNSGTSLQVSWGGTPGVGDGMVVRAGTGAADVSISNSGYTQGVDCNNTTEADRLKTFLKKATASEDTSVTITVGASDEMSLKIQTHEGPFQDLPAGIDLAEPEGRQASGTSLVISPTGTTDQASQLALVQGYTRHNGNANNTTLSDGFTEDMDVGTQYKSWLAGHKVLTATGAVTTTMSFTNSTVSIGGMCTWREAAAAATKDQEGYRWRNDDGNETSATWKSAQDTAAFLPLNENGRIRLLINATLDPASFSPTLEYKREDEGSWADVPVGSGTRLFISPSANITAGGEVTTAQLTPPAGKTTGDFVTGRMWDDENGTDAIDITSDDYTEVEWSVQFQSPAVDGEVYQFRVKGLDSYSFTAQVTVGQEPTPIVMGRKFPVIYPVSGPFNPGQFLPTGGSPSIIAPPLFDASLTADAVASGSLSTEVRLAAALSGSAISSSPLTTDIRFGSQLSATAAVSGDIQADIELAAALVASAIMAGDLSADVQMNSNLTASAVAAAALETAIKLDAALNANGSVDADLTSGSALLTANLAAAATLVSGITTEIRLISFLSASGSIIKANTSLTTAIRLASALNAAATLGAPLTTAIHMAAALLGTGKWASSLLQTEIRMGASLVSSASISGQLAIGDLSAAFTSTATIGGEIQTEIELSGSLSSIANVQAALSLFFEVPPRIVSVTQKENSVTVTLVLRGSTVRQVERGVTVIESDDDVTVTKH